MDTLQAAVLLCLTEAFKQSNKTRPSTTGPKYRANRHKEKLRDSTSSPKHGDIRRSSETLHVAPNMETSGEAQRLYK